MGSKYAKKIFLFKEYGWFGVFFLFFNVKKITVYLYICDYRMLTRECLCHLIVTTPSVLHVDGIQLIH